MSRTKKILKFLLISVVIIFSVCMISGFGYFYAVTHSVTLSTNKLSSSTSNKLKIYDKNHNQILPTSENHIKISTLSKNTKNAFITAEDKRFYKHSGIDYIRIGGAIISNIKSKSFSEGASTISQQLVKNTHLSNEKTIKRKLKEIKLTKQLEQKYSKDQILEMYLNNIYFGGGAYGIENAAKHYFNKSSSDLTLAESSLLAATINAPSIYDIENNTEKTIKRRNLILNNMKKQNKITSEEYYEAIAEPITLNLTKLQNTNYIYNQVLKEACQILKVNENTLKNQDLQINTYFDLALHNSINETIKEKYSNINSNPNIASIVIDNKTNGILAIIGSSQTLNSNKQPGSTIKPILVYGPAIENNIISPATKLVDEKINISGYSPENADKKYHGQISARDALKNSYNIPAVKLLNEIGIQKAQEFTKKLGIDFSQNDNNLSIALGGFTNGITLKNLADSYTSLASNGWFSKSSFIKAIKLNNKTIYKNNNKKTQAMKDSTAYLLTSMLIDTAKTGTAKRLKDFDFEIASKTGTVGKPNSSKNTDAYNISYTSKHTILSYFGAENMPENINGATYPTMLSKDILTKLYTDKKPDNFIIPKSVQKQKIDKKLYESGTISLTDADDNYLEEYFAKTNLPSNKGSLSTELKVFNFENKKPIISFHSTSGNSYKIIRKNKKKEEVIFFLNNVKNAKIITFEDKNAQKDEIYEYYLQIINISSNKIYTSKHIKLKSF